MGDAYILYSGWLQHDRKDGKDWNEIWAVIKTDGVIGTYKDNTTKENELIGRLTLTESSEVSLVKKNKMVRKQNYYGFKLVTTYKNAKGDKIHLKNYFRTKEEYSRNMWIESISAVSKGEVQPNARITPDQKIKLYNYLDVRPEMLKKIAEIRQRKMSLDSTTGVTRASTVTTTASRPLAMKDTRMERRFTESDIKRPLESAGAVRLDLRGRHASSETPPPLPPGRPDVYVPIAGACSKRLSASSVSSAGSVFSGTSDRDSAFGSDSGVFMPHKFFRDPEDNCEVPPWFFELCSRELAEKILHRSVQKGLGNILIRESVSRKGNYSASILHKPDRIQHCEIQKFGQNRFWIDIDKKDERQLICLYDVVLLLVATLGSEYFPMRSHHLTEYGIEPVHYDRVVDKNSRAKLEPPFPELTSPLSPMELIESIYTEQAEDEESSENDDYEIPMSIKQKHPCANLPDVPRDVPPDVPPPLPARIREPLYVNTQPTS
ncbi:uncharacterized protein LOC141899963 isoform X2 [Tubulanus polymorphus]|uniref:uncharacterized protein LOC141899963 isoform X2 n=1 Tax=Tubulanus polymorphus TaxID=672921 RepID=UPI003DA3C0B8